MPLSATLATLDEIRPFRQQLQEETGGQSVHDSLHLRRGWTESYLLKIADAPVGYGSIALAGPWQDRPTIFEFYLAPEHRLRVFALFETFLAASGAKFFEVQTNHTLLTTLLHAYGRDIVSEKIVFEDHSVTHLPAQGTVLKRANTAEESFQCFINRQGSTDWVLELDGLVIGTGGIAFHYNHPYGDVYMEIFASHRRRGFGAYLVQELKVVAREMGAIPTARCNPANLASRLTLQKAGFTPRGHILDGTVVWPAPPAPKPAGE